MRKSTVVLLVLICLGCIGIVQAGPSNQTLPFEPLSNVTGNYTFSQGNDVLKFNTNFPVSSGTVVYPDWLFGMMLLFIFMMICFELYLISRNDPSMWISVLACGMVVLGLGLSAAVMAPFVGYTTVFHQIITVNATNTIYVNEVIVYTMAEWMSNACYGLGIGGGLMFGLIALFMQMRQARNLANKTKDEKIAAGEINFRVRDRK